MNQNDAASPLPPLLIAHCADPAQPCAAPSPAASLESADVLVLHDTCEADLLPLVSRRRRRGLITVFEVSADLHELPSWHPRRSRFASAEACSLLRRIVHHCDGVVFASRHLQRLYGYLNPRQLLRPAALLMLPPRQVQGGGPLRLGWAGDRPEDLAAIAGPLDAWLRSRADVELRLREGEGSGARAAFLAGLDVGLLPLQDSAYNRALGDGPCLDLMARGVVPLVQALEPYLGSVRQAETGFLFASAAELLAELDLLAADPALRERLAAAAYRAAGDRVRPTGEEAEVAWYRQLLAAPGHKADALAGVGSIEGLLQEGSVLLEGGAAALAFERFVAAAEIFPTYELPYLAAAQALDVLGGVGSADAAALRQRARDLFMELHPVSRPRITMAQMDPAPPSLRPRQRVVVAIPHYWSAGAAAGGAAVAGREAPGGAAVIDARGALNEPAARRAEGLRAALAALRGLSGEDALVMHQDGRAPSVVPPAYQVDAYVLTAGDQHVLPLLGVPPSWYRHVPTGEQARWLPFTAHDLLAEAGAADWYVAMDDDLCFEDPDWLRKLGAFLAQAGEDAVLLPQLYEAAAGSPARLYLSGGVMAGLLPADRRPPGPPIELRYGDQAVRCVAPQNPHSAFFALSAGQFDRFRRQPGFRRRSESFIGPGETAMTLLLQQTFTLYKPAWEQASFFALRHHGDKYLRLTRG